MKDPRIPSWIEAVSRSLQVFLAGAALSATCMAATAPAPSPEIAKDLKAATSAVASNDLSAAQRIFSELAARNPQEVRARLGLADVAYRTGNIREAETIIRQAVQDFPREAGVQVALGRFLYAQKRFKEAETALLAAKALDDAAYINVDLGTLYAEALDQPIDAIDYFYRALGKSPNLPGAHFAVGQLLANQGNWSQAKIEFEKATRLDPKNVMPWVGLARAAVQLRQTPLALSAYAKAAALSPKNTLIELEVADLQNALGKDKDALTGYQNAAKNAPSTFDAWLKLGMFHQSRGHLAEADEAYAKALALDPASALALNNRAALALEGKGSLSAAIGWARQAVELSPTTTYFLDTLGALLEKDGKLVEAQQKLEAALKLDPDYLGARYHLATVLRGLGRTSEANQLVLDTLQTNRSFPERAAFEKLRAELNAAPAK